MKMITDKAFGVMRYNHSWERSETLHVFDQEFQIRVVAEAYNEEDITNVQRDAYKRYLQEYDGLTELIPGALCDYYKDNYESLSEGLIIPEQINKENITKTAIIKLIRITSLFFDRNGEYGYLCDCAWDEEHGICILLSGQKPEITEQDYLL